MKAISRLLLIVLLLLAAAPLPCCGRAEPVTIRYAAWNLGGADNNGLERRMVAAFNGSHTGVRVVIDERFTAGYDAAFAKAASGGALPDVFMFGNVPEADALGYCADISRIASGDGDWAGIPAALRSATEVKGRTVAIPSAYYLCGYFCNADLFAAKGAPVPVPGWGVDGFRAAASAATDLNGRTVGLAEESAIIDWYPAAASGQMGWYSWDGGKFNLDSKEFAGGIRLARSLYERKQVYTALSESEKAGIGFATDWEAWKAGRVAMKFDGTWAAGDYAKLGFTLRFAGLPGGRACIVPDFLFISKTSAHPKEAYEFAKFMSAYSSAGFSERLKIAKAQGFIVTSMPMVRSPALVDAYFSAMPVPGVREVYDTVTGNSYVEGVKVLPGFAAARWNCETNISVGSVQNVKIGDVLTDAYSGATDFDAVAERLNSAANACIRIYPLPADN